MVRTRLRACWSHGDGTDDGLSAPLSKLSIKGDHLWPLTAQVREFAPHETRLSLLTYLHRFNLETLALVDSGVSAWGIGGCSGVLRKESPLPSFSHLRGSHWVRRMTKVDEAKAVPGSLTNRHSCRGSRSAAQPRRHDSRAGPSSLMPDRIPAGQTLKIQILQRRVLM